MNKMRATVLLTAMGLAGVACADTSRVSVNWAPTDTLTEVKDNPSQRGQMRPQDWMGDLAAFLQKRADKQLPAGDRLEVTIDDIKLAGGFEPWHGPNADNIRFMKDVYPPRASLHYKLVDADGHTVREGSNKLLDLGYLERPPLPTDTDPLRFDKRMLDDWLKKEFRGDGVAER